MVESKKEAPVNTCCHTKNILDQVSLEKIKRENITIKGLLALKEIYLPYGNG